MKSADLNLASDKTKWLVDAWNISSTIKPRMTYAVARIQSLITSLSEGTWGYAKASRLSLALAVTFVILNLASGNCAVTVTFPNSQVQSDFIAVSTGQWISTVKPGLFAGDYKIAVTAKNDSVPVPVPVPLPTTGSAMDSLTAFMVGRGMDFERYANIQQLRGMQSQEALSGSCGGTPVEFLTSTTSVLGACVQEYNMAVSTISQRWGYVYDPTGKVVAR